MGKLLRGPAMITIPLAALGMVLAIGIPIGLLFIQVHNSFNANTTLVVAVALTGGIMAAAGFLSYNDYKNPPPAKEAPTRPTARPRGDAKAGPRAPVTTRPARGKSRPDGRRKPR